MQTGPWDCTHEGLRHTRALITFQRFPKPAELFAAESVRSYGVLLPEQVGQEIVLPLPDDDAFWIGAMLSDDEADTVALHATLANGRRIALSGTRRASLLTIMGFTDDSVFRPLAHPSVRAIEVLIGSDAVSVQIVTPDRYTELTGRAGPEPLHDDSAYKGWRLP